MYSLKYFLPVGTTSSGRGEGRQNLHHHRPQTLNYPKCRPHLRHRQGKSCREGKASRTLSKEGTLRRTVLDAGPGHGQRSQQTKRRHRGENSYLDQAELVNIMDLFVLAVFRFANLVLYRKSLVTNNF